MNSDKSTFKHPKDIMGLFSGHIPKLNRNVPAIFLENSPTILCNFSRNESENDFMLKTVLQHELYHRYFVFECLPLQSYYWMDVSLLRNFEQLLENIRRNHIRRAI